MSKENLDQFIQKVTDSEELQTRIGEEMDTDAFIALGAEHGCEFSADDLTAGSELSDEELDGVAGGLAVQSAKTGTNDQNQSLSWGRAAAAGQTTGCSQAKPLEKAQRDCGVALCLDQAGDGISEVDGSRPARDQNSMGAVVHGVESA